MEIKPQSDSSSLRSRIQTFVELPRFGQSILVLILLNAVLLGMKTSAVLRVHLHHGLVPVADDSSDFFQIDVFHTA